MGKSFRTDDLNQSLLSPSRLHERLPENHLARFVAHVVTTLDLDAIDQSHNERDGRGMAAYVPVMMVRLLLHGHAKGTFISRKIQARTYDDVAFRYPAAGEHPDHDTFANFRTRTLMRWAACPSKPCYCSPRQGW